MMMELNKQHVIKLIGYASGIAANNIDCALGPWYLYYHQHFFNQSGFQVEWEAYGHAKYYGAGFSCHGLC